MDHITVEPFQQVTIKSYLGNDNTIHISVKPSPELEPEITGVLQVF
jgi:hypothetical protein